jgi:hypothetical protein
VFELATSQLNYIMQTAATRKIKSGLGKSSGIKRRNKKEASEWFQSLSHIEQLLVKQESNTSSSSKERKPKKEMHERERELLLKRRSEHEARMKAQLESKAKITQQIQKCQEMRRQLIPYHMRLYQMRLKQMQPHDDYTRSSHFQFKLGMMECGISNQIRLIQNEEKVLFDMQHKHHFIKKSITEIIEKRKTSPFSKLYTRVQTKNYVDDVYKLMAV